MNGSRVGLFPISPAAVKPLTVARNSYHSTHSLLSIDFHYDVLQKPAIRSCVARLHPICLRRGLLNVSVFEASL